MMNGVWLVGVSGSCLVGQRGSFHPCQENHRELPNAAWPKPRYKPHYKPHAERSKPEEHRIGFHPRVLLLLLKTACFKLFFLFS
jgi:hypothetical protein